MHGQQDGPADPREREHRINDAFVEVTGALARGEDAAGLLERLTARCTELLAVTVAGLLLADARGALHLLAASSMESRDLDVLQVGDPEGPGHDCRQTGRQVVVADLAEHALRWPRFVPTALQAGFRSVHALPVRRRTHTLGTLVLLGDDTRTLDDQDLSLAQALADVASIALALDPARDDDLTAPMQAALDDRVVLEQAKGFLAQRGHLSLTQASEAMRRFAAARDLRSVEVARGVVTRTLPSAALLEGFDSRT